jgi:long-chain acyl-CoA synthetase
VVGLIGDNRPDWVMGEIAAHALGARSLGIYRDALEDEVAYLLEFCGVKAVLAEDEEQVDKLLNISDRVPTLRHIVYSDPRGMRKYSDPRLLPASELVKRGEEAHEAAPAAWGQLVDATAGEEVAILCTTSGTTARPKLAMLTSLRADPALRELPQGRPAGAGGRLRLGAAAALDHGAALRPRLGLIARMRVNFVEEPETTMADFREIGPNFVLFAPRVWESLAADVRARVMDASPLKRGMFALGMRMGLGALKRGRRSAWRTRCCSGRCATGWASPSCAPPATGGAALGPETFRFFQAMGVPLRQLYGQTETLGAYTVHRPDDVNQDTVGVAFNDRIETRIDNPDPNGLGEIVTRHPNMFSGYYKLPENNDLRDGWLHTGDAGYFDKNGHLVVIDRVKDLATTSGGDRFSPQYIENKLKFSPYVAEAVVLGDGRPHLAAMICIRFPIVSKWAERQRISFTTYTDLSAKPEVLEMLSARWRR